MKKAISILAAFAVTLILSTGLRAQFSQPLSWTLKADKTAEGQYDIIATGTFSSDGWHTYDLAEYKNGPISTTFEVTGEGVTPVGGPEILSKVDRHFDDAFGMEVGTCSGTVIICQKVQAASDADAEVYIEWQCCREGSCIAPDEFTGTVHLGGGAIVSQASAEQASPAAPEGGKSIWGLILEAVAWGLVALLTPCVFPMIPMTVSFFIKQNGARGKFLALAFGICIVALYTIPIALLIVISLLTGGQAVTADIFNWLATHWLPNILFFTIFMLFAASFFGAFEIRMPSRLVNDSDAKSEKGGLLGVFFVALTLVLVSFSCTGPIVGSVLIKSTQGQFWEPIITMLAFSVAFALPFTIFAFAPTLLKKLPKSGGWLNSVKVVLGFIEIALGMKFLSVADQTYHWGILPREVYLAIWIVVFTMLGFYLLGKIRFEYDSPVEHIGVLRLVLAIAVFSFVVWMIPGMWGAPLKSLSGYLPPVTTQEFNLTRTSEAQAYAIPAASKDAPSRRYADFLELPYGIPAFFDYNEARAYAQETGKPLFIDFTGHGCVNCREMESRVWSDPRALRMMKEDYVVCALYADDKKVVDEADWITTESGKVLKSLGKINSHFALTRFNVNAQPYYAILDPATEQHKVPARGYDLDVEHFVNFLQEGLK